MARGAAGVESAGHARPALFVPAWRCSAVAARSTRRRPRAADPVIAAAGDIACSSSSSNYNGGNGTADKCRQRYTSDLLVNAGLAAVLPLGDTQYESASLSGLNNSYHPTWGRVKSITRPAPGNHEYKTAGAAGYFDYFNGVGQATGPAGDRTKGYYSFNVGTWHLIALNSTDHCTIVPCGVGSAQETWLKADLAANADKYCTLAYWHDPRFNSGHDGNADEMAPLFQALYNADADVVLGGHAHDYERFAPQNPSGAARQRARHPAVRRRHGRRVLHERQHAEAEQPGPPEQHLRRAEADAAPDRLRLAVRLGERQAVHGLRAPGQCHGGTPPPRGSDTQKPTVPGASPPRRAAAGSRSTGTPPATTWGSPDTRIYRGGTPDRDRRDDDVLHGHDAWPQAPPTPTR